VKAAVCRFRTGFALHQRRIAVTTNKTPLRSIGRIEIVQDGRILPMWQILQLAEMPEGATGHQPTEPDWVKVMGTANYTTKSAAEAGLKQLEGRNHKPRAKT